MYSFRRNWFKLPAGIFHMRSAVNIRSKRKNNNTHYANNPFRIWVYVCACERPWSAFECNVFILSIFVVFPHNFCKQLFHLQYIFLHILATAHIFLRISVDSVRFHLNDPLPVLHISITCCIKTVCQFKNSKLVWLQILFYAWATQVKLRKIISAYTYVYWGACVSIHYINMT